MPITPPHDDDTRHHVPVVALLLALVVLLGGTAAGLTLLTRHGAVPGATGEAGRTGGAASSRTSSGGHSSRPGGGVSQAAWDACAPPLLGTQPGAPPQHVGWWPYRLLVAGTFDDAVPDLDGGLYMLQACGAEETSLRVVRMDERGKVTAVSRMFPRAALLTSGLVATPAGVVLGTATLDLAGAPGLAPYDLEAVHLDPATLNVTGETPLGRGQGVDLAALGESAAGRASLLATTGARLLAIGTSASGRLEVTRLLAFDRAVAQHLAVEPQASAAVVSLLVPGATGPGATTRLEVIRVSHAPGGSPVARVVAVRDLRPGTAVQSLVVAGGAVFWSGGRGAATAVHASDLPGLTPLAPAGHPGASAGAGGATGAGSGAGAPAGTGEGTATLQPVGLDASGGTVFVHAVTSVECLSATTGRVLAATAPRGSPPPVVTEMVRSASSTFALTSWGVGLLGTPVACTMPTGR